MTNRRKPTGRDVDGILLLDKPVGISSNAALQRAKRLFQAHKAGHTGNLDVLASGVLPVCFGDATKVSSYLLNADKRYRTTGLLGTMTSTGDAEGEVIKSLPVPDISAAELHTLLTTMTGRQEQVPPMFSALKHQGQPLYKLARKGIEIERKARTVEIFDIRLLEFDGQQMSLDVRCSKGTYIRTLVEDIGTALGSCATVTALRRTAASDYLIDDCVTLEQLQSLAEQGKEQLDALLYPVDSVLGHLPAIELSEHTAMLIKQGQSVELEKVPDTELLRLYEENGQFLGIGQVREDQRVAPRRLMRQSTPDTGL
jgi:tRNA pseudouridine55 synthase